MGYALDKINDPALRAKLAAGGNVSAPKKPGKRLRQKSGDGMNKTERRFFAWLKETRPNCTHLPQSITLKLCNGVRFTPDFISVRADEAIGFTLTAWETKGFMRDDAAVKLKVAAKEYPFITFILVTARGHDAWDMQEILP
jgi:hypothetical protein